VRERVLREVRDSDIPIFFEHQREPEANEMALFPARDERTFVAHWRKLVADEGLIKKTIVCDGRVAGNILCFERDGRHEVGYWIGKEFWGRGLATRALAELLEEVATRPLYAVVATTNIGSIRVLEKCGFTVVESRTEQDEAWGGEVEELVLELPA
jgi:RimJ/RimL family protein N-acetyltransferase